MFTSFCSNHDEVLKCVCVCVCRAVWSVVGASPYSLPANADRTLEGELPSTPSSPPAEQAKAG